MVEILEEMARHPGLVDRDIPFIILANKQDKDDAIDEKEITKYLQLDNLKSISKLKYKVLDCTGLAKDGGVDHAFKLFS